MTNTTETKETLSSTIGQVHELVHEEEHSTPTRKIAIAIDESPSSEHAVNWAIQNVINKETDQVVLLNVRPFASVPIGLVAPMMQVGDEYGLLDAQNKEFSHNLIRKVARGMIEKGFKTSGIALRGDAKEELVYKIEEMKADVLIIGSRGMGIFKRMVLGSVSDYCVHHCKCTVIVPKMP